MTQDPERMIAAARTVLEGLQQVTAGGDPFAPAPQQAIDHLHQVVRVIAPRKAQRAYRLDGLHAINRQYLHNHVRDMLSDLDRLVAENPRLQQRPTR